MSVDTPTNAASSYVYVFPVFAIIIRYLQCNVV